MIATQPDERTYDSDRLLDRWLFSSMPVICQQLPSIRGRCTHDKFPAVFWQITA